MYPNIPSAPTMTSPATLQLGKSRPHNAEIQESSWEIIRVNTTGAMLTRQKSTPSLYFHGRTNKVYTLEGTEVPIERPPRNLIIEYQETLLTLPQFSLAQIRLLQTNNSIEYDKNLHAYYTPVLNSDKRFYHFAFRCLPQWKTTIIRKRETAHQNLEKNYKKYKEKLEKKQLLYWERKTLTQHLHKRLTQNFEILKQKVKPKLNKKENIKQISDKPRHTSLQSKELSNKKTAGFPR